MEAAPSSVMTESSRFVCGIVFQEVEKKQRLELMDGMRWMVHTPFAIQGTS